MQRIGENEMMSHKSVYRNIKIGLFAIHVLFALSCKDSSNKSKQDEFYTDKGGWDYARFPLIKPYEARVVASFENWIVRLDSTSYDGTVPNVKRLNVIGDSMIVLYSTNTLLDGLPTRESWYIIIPKRHMEKGFSNRHLYMKCLDSLGFKREPRLFDINRINHDFQNNDKISWGNY